MTFKRFCNRCEVLFQPTGPACRLCNECKKASYIKRDKKRIAEAIRLKLVLRVRE